MKIKKPKIKFRTFRGIGKHILDDHTGFWKMLIRKRGKSWICKICDWEINRRR